MISIVIPTYNRQDLLKKSIEAILANTMLPGEIIIVEQGDIKSTKNALKDINFDLKIFHFNELSASKARNYGVEKSSGELIYFVDDDLEIEKVYIKKAFGFFKNNKNAKIVCGRDKKSSFTKPNFFKLFFRVILGQDGFTNKRKVLKNGLNIVRLDFKKASISMWASGMMVVKKELFKQGFLFPKDFVRWSYKEDVYFSYSVYKKYNNSIYFLPNLNFSHIKSEINRISSGESIKMQIIYNYIFFKNLVFENNYLNLLYYIYSEFFKALFFIKNNGFSKFGLIKETYFYLLKNYKKIDKKQIDFNEFIFIKKD